MQQLVRLSPSKIATWQDCPRRFYLEYVRREPSTGVWAHLSLGQSIHAALKDWYDDSTTTRSFATLQELMVRNWVPAGFANDEQSTQWRDWATTITWQYLQQRQAEAGHATTHSVERTLAARTEHAAIGGRIDRLDVDGSELIVIDYKTGSSVPGVDQARSSLALALYAICVQRTLRRPCHRVELHHVPSGVVAAWEHSDEALTRQLRRVDQIAQDIREQEMRVAQGEPVDEVYPPSPGGLCSYCGYRDMCPEGTQARPARQPWEGLPTLVDDGPEDCDSSI